MVDPIMIEIGAGELIDRITILEIKSERIKESAKLEYVNKELGTLKHCRDQIAKSSMIDFKHLESELKKINECLWTVEEKLRIHERASAFNEQFIELARYVYQFNDKRYELKRGINQLVNSRVVEQKSF